jgi:hypothetical protein
MAIKNIKENKVHIAALDIAFLLSTLADFIFEVFDCGYHFHLFN